MAIYKFRISFEDYEDITRDIEIKSSQTFFDFFQCILQSIGFDNKQAGSFFLSDDYWSKNAEITLLEDDLEPGVKLMKQTRMATMIDQPNQRFVFLYDKEARWSLLIELIKLVPETAGVIYPRCLKSVGTAPKQYKQKLMAKLKEEVENGTADEKIPDEEIYKAITDEKIIFDEEEETTLHEDENDLVDKEEESDEADGTDEADDQEPEEGSESEDTW